MFICMFPVYYRSIIYQLGQLLNRTQNFLLLLEYVFFFLIQPLIN